MIILSQNKKAMFPNIENYIITSSKAEGVRDSAIFARFPTSEDLYILGEYSFEESVEVLDYIAFKISEKCKLYYMPLAKGE